MALDFTGFDALVVGGVIARLVDAGAGARPDDVSVRPAAGFAEEEPALLVETLI